MNKELFYSVGLAVLLHLIFVFFPTSSHAGAAFSRPALKVHTQKEYKSPKKSSKKSPGKRSSKEKPTPQKDKKKLSKKRTNSKKSSSAKPNASSAYSSKAKEAVLEDLSKSIRSLEEDLASLEEFEEFEELKEIEIQKIDFSQSIEQGHFFSSYGNLLSKSLQERLKLPEYGSVELLLTIDQFGNVLAVEILASESKKNQLFVQEMLAKMRFTGLPQGQEKKTFHLSLSNQL